MSKKLVFFLIVLSIASAGALWSLFSQPQPDPAAQAKAAFPASAGQALAGKMDSKQKRHLRLGTPEFTDKPKQQASILEQYAQHAPKQWALKDISALKAWEETKGDKNIVVAVIDTGIHTEHSCLKPSLWTNRGEIPGNGIDDDGNGYADDVHGWNFAENNSNIQDFHGHGTHIAGVIAAAGKTPKSPGCQVIGIAPKASLMILKYYSEDDPSKNLENTIKSIEYAINNGAHIINYSGGGPGKNNHERRAVARASDKKILFVAAAGNDGRKIEKGDPTRVRAKAGAVFEYYPASYGFPNIFLVQSISEGSDIIQSSNWVTKISHHKDDGGFKERSQAAPGEEIISTLPPRRYVQGRLSGPQRKIAAARPLRQDNYGQMTGTSQATAVATGVAVLVKAYYPGIGMSQLIQQLAKTGFGRGTEKIRRKTNQGKKLDAYQALIMRQRVMDTSDRPSDSDAIMPTDPEALMKLKSSRGMIDVHGKPPSKHETFKNLHEIMARKLSSPDPNVRKDALRSIGEAKTSSDEDWSKVRETMRSDPDPEVRELAAATLKKITPRRKKPPSQPNIP